MDRFRKIFNLIKNKFIEKIEKIKNYPFFTATKLRYLKNIPSKVLKKIGICLISIFGVIILFFITFAITNSANKNQNTKNKNYNIEEIYWGNWQSFNNLSELRIDENCVSKKIDGEFKKMQNSIVGYELDSNNIMTNGNSRYFRKNRTNLSFSMFIEKPKEMDIYPVSIKRFSKDGFGGIQVKNIKQDTSITFENATSNCFETIIVDGKNDFHEEFDVFPKFDGEFLGKIPVVPSDSWALKTSYDIEVDETGFCYGNLYDEYGLLIKLENIGNGKFKKGSYEIHSSDNLVSFIDGNVKIEDKTFETSSLKGECGEIESGFYLPLYFKIKYGILEEEKKSIPIQITLTDSEGQKQTDTISVQFHKGKVPIYLDSKNQIKNSTSKFTPIIIYPDGYGKKIEIDSNKKKTFFVPWAEDDYNLILTGANVSGDIAYSFSLADKSKLPLIPEKWSVKEMKNYEPNDSIEDALKLNSLKNICSYLRTDDVDCFSFNTSNLRNNF